MPPPQNPKEVKQFLGLAGYYRKFVPQFADIACPLNALTRKGVEFIWTEVCQESFKLLKQKLLEKLILVYPDPTKPYVLFTDASKYAWSCVLTRRVHPYHQWKRGKGTAPHNLYERIVQGKPN